MGDLLGATWHGVATVLQPTNLGLLLAGLLFGAVFGILPGVSVLTAVILVLPLTYSLTADGSLIMLISIYVAGIFAGSATAILFNMPGDPQNAATTIDGYPMTRKGESVLALCVANVSSAVGGLLGTAILVLVTGQLAKLSLAFGPAEYFGLTFLSLAAVVGLSQGAYLKTLVSLAAGLVLAVPGVSEVVGDNRLTFGISAFQAGFNFVPIIIGALALSEVFEQASSPDAMPLPGGKALRPPILLSARETRAFTPTWLRSGVLGTVIGALPGAGATVAAFLCYYMERALHRDGPKFGTGVPAGVAAPETGNNAAGMGTLVPLLALGIPGGGVAAVMLGAFQIHGLRPGPLLFLQQRDLVASLFVAAFVANALILAIGPFQAKYVSHLLRIPSTILYPTIVMFCVVGSFAVNNNMFDVWVMLGAAVLGSYMRANGYSVIALTLGLVLGPIAEGAFVQGLIMFSSPLDFVMRPLSGTLIATGLLLAAWPAVTTLRSRGRGRGAKAGVSDG